MSKDGCPCGRFGGVNHRSVLQQSSGGQGSVDQQPEMCGQRSRLCGFCGSGEAGQPLLAAPGVGGAPWGAGI
ncbi:hypothetical protein ACFT8V_20020 [Streptomyces griseoincarnatus]|uniref:hypothetical protein n=1 Tax=unclassified Streptomyces TaxID=2593676 RepID=UPI000FE25957|nr:MULTISPECIES: hypothetical protein [unclassified Streptomyces]MBJ6641977.1 hypothetical protein [Streptomyces sp. BSE7-9]MCA2202478.1 hypothetical protein [Streptomyces sp. SMS_SU21]NEA95745.1 hypothetical protein [Actinospica acidiphila]